LVYLGRYLLSVRVAEYVVAEYAQTLLEHAHRQFIQKGDGLHAVADQTRVVAVLPHVVRLCLDKRDVVRAVLHDLPLLLTDGLGLLFLTLGFLRKVHLVQH
jgi:hypothetical protein